jgi:hypothetical protein
MCDLGVVMLIGFSMIGLGSVTCCIPLCNDLNLLRRFTIARNDMYFAFCLEPDFWTAVCILLCRGRVYCLTK